VVIRLEDYIRRIPDYPKPGIIFYDIATLLRHPEAWAAAVEQMAAAIAPHRPALLAGIESRGFLVVAPLALKLGCGLLMVRKKGKLPGQTVRHEYALEYGTDTIEVQADAVDPGQRIVLLDDLLATGGTAAAAISLLRRLGGEVVGASFIIGLDGLGGRKRLDVPVSALLSFPA